MLIVIQIYSKKVNDNLPMQTMSTEDKPMMFCLVKCNQPYATRKNYN